MKTKVEIEGYEIEISFLDGVISVVAEKDEEVVEEFSINVEESQDDEDFSGEEEVQNFGEYEEEDDFDGSEDLDDELESQDDEDDEDEDESQDQAQGAALESFQSFINKKKK